MKLDKYFSLDKITCYVVTLLIVVFTVLSIILITTADISEDGENNRSSPIWMYQCQENRCVKLQWTAETGQSGYGLIHCRKFCGHTANSIDIWPMVTGSIRPILSNNPLNQHKYVSIDWQSIKFRNNPSKVTSFDFWTTNEQRFMQQILVLLPKSNNNINTVNQYAINIDVTVQQASVIKLSRNVEEKYSLSIEVDDSINNVIVHIEADTIYGARNGLESLAQIIFFDDYSNRLLMRGDIEITDAPAYKHRGIALDTSRNYMSIDAIKRTIDAMALVKLNKFHWHITDSHSFPLVIESEPYLSHFGAYTPEMIFTAVDVKDIVKYAEHRGIQVIPEFDAPAHVGEGWQFTNLTTCFNAQPWGQYCYEPPCGQFDPSKPELYPILENIYREMIEMFDDPDTFHMGGDEVSFSCWASSESLRQWMLEQGWQNMDDDYVKLWGYFQENALNRLDRIGMVNGEKRKIILWTSTLTEEEYIDQYLDNERYVIQVWSDYSDPKINILLAKGFDVIISNNDILYLDCGYESWTGLGNNWCGPYHGWHEIYSYNLKRSINAELYGQQIIGAEASLWSEQVDDKAVDGRFWPRGIALAERLWSDPITSYRDAESRILLQRERFVQWGLKAESLQPKWCLQNEKQCHS